MAARELNVELLLSRRVYALNGHCIGRLEEIRAEMRGDECIVTEYLVGVYALFERLAAWSVGRAVLACLGWKAKGGGYRVPWDALDLSDPQKLRLKRPVSELAHIDEEAVRG